MKDFYGKELSYGDQIVFTSGSGWLREGVFIRTGPKGFPVVRATRYASSDKPITRTVYLDNRTGRLVRRYGHIKKEGHWVHAVTGEALTGLYHREYMDFFRKEKNEAYVSPAQRKWVDVVYQDYLIPVELPGSKAIVLHSSGQIIKL
jgi:hypothetical protein